MMIIFDASVVFIYSGIKNTFSVLIDAIHSTLHLEDQPDVFSVGSFRAPAAAKTFSLHLLFKLFYMVFGKTPTCP